MRHADPNEHLARSRRGDGAGAVVGIGPGADDRRVADTVPALAGHPAGRGSGGNMAVLV